MQNSTAQSNYLLPHGYISWTQMSTWEQNRERYIREYIEGGRRLDTKALRFGKMIATIIEENAHQLHNKIWQTSVNLPNIVTYEYPEYEIRTTIDGVPILAKIDSYSEELGTFREYKTGKIAWTAKKVYAHGQLLFYATCLDAIGKKVEMCYLDWLPTREFAEEGLWNEMDKRLGLTGEIYTFERYFDDREIENMKERIKTTAEEITETYKQILATI